MTWQPERVLALDIATHCGWAAYDQGRISFGSFDVADKNAALGEFLCRYGRRLRDLITLHNPDIVAKEASFAGGPKMNQQTLRKLLGAAGETDRVCYIKELRCWDVDTNEAMKCFAGRSARGDAKKRLSIETARSRGYDVTCHDESDALAVLSWTLHSYKINHPLALPGMFAKAAQ